MKFLSTRELRAATGKPSEMLANNGHIVLTTNEKPAALIIEIYEDSFEEVLADIRLAKTRFAIRQMQEHSARSGINNMSLDEVNAEIAAARSEKIAL